MGGFDQMVNNGSPDVILLRSADEPDSYVRAFREVGLEAVCVPVLSFSFPRGERLRKHLQNKRRYVGLIATSPRAANALQRVFEGDEGLAGRWEGTPAYVVGPKTGDRFRSLGLDVRGKQTGTADALASLVTEATPQRPLLFLSGNRRRDTLPDALRTSGVAFDEVVVYETHTRTDLSLPRPVGETWLAFFSPSGLEAVGHSDALPLEGYWCAAIGPTTAAALRERGLTVHAVAETPSPEGLVTAVIGASRHQSED